MNGSAWQFDLLPELGELASQLAHPVHDRLAAGSEPAACLRRWRLTPPPMSAHPAPRATRSIRAETAGSSGLALGPNQRGKAGGEVEASIPVMAIAHQRTRRRVRRRTHDLARGQDEPKSCGG